MQPGELSNYLRQIATSIDASEEPSLLEVQAAIVAAIESLAAPDDFHPRGNKPRPAPPVPAPSTNIAPPPPKKPTYLPKTVNPKPDPSNSDNNQKELNKLERERRKMKEEMPEYASFEAFARFLDEHDRDTYTIGERNKFCEIHGISPDMFKQTMQGFQKYMLLNLPGSKIKAPVQILDKAARELGVSVSEVKQFLNLFDDPADIPVDSKPIIEEMKIWLAD